MLDSPARRADDGKRPTGDASVVRSFEFMRIEREEGGLVFRVSPGGEG